MGCHHLGWEPWGSAIVLTADDTDLEPDVADQLDIVLHGEVRVGLSRVKSTREVCFHAANPLFVWHCSQSFGG